MVPIRSSTQNFLEIEDIKDDLIILRDGSSALVLETSAVNFGLLSKEEQETIIFAFAAFLNSLSFPIQINILSKRMDISSYLDLISQKEQKQSQEKLKERLKNYYQFIVSLVKENQVLEKRFFIIIPFFSFELGIKKATSPDYILQRAKTALYPKKDHIIRQLSRVGLKASQLKNQALIELFYEIYNPDVSDNQKVPEDATKPIINIKQKSV